MIICSDAHPLSLRAVCCRIIRLYCFIAVVISTSGSVSVGQDATRPGEAPAAEKATAKITEKEVEDFANQLTEAAVAGDIPKYNQLVNWDRIIDKATEVPKSEELENARKEFKKGALAELRRTGGLVARINSDIKRGGSYKNLRSSLEGAEPYVMFRLKVPQGGGVNYHQLFLERDSDGKVVCGDMFVFLSAERISHTFRRSWLPLANEILKNAGALKPGSDDPFVSSITDFKKFTDLVAREKYKDALEAYKKLPVAVQKDKNALLVRLRAAQAVSETEYSDVLDDFRRFHPDDIALDFLLIDAYAIRKQHEAALRYAERTFKNVGGDPLMRVIQANLLIVLKRYPEARRAIEEAILQEPKLMEAYSAGLDLSLADQNFDETVKYLTTLETDFNVKWKDLREVPVFADFVNSPQYRTWVERQK